MRPWRIGALALAAAGAIGCSATGPGSPFGGFSLGPVAGESARPSSPPVAPGGQLPVGGTSPPASAAPSAAPSAPPSIGPASGAASGPGSPVAVAPAGTVRDPFGLALAAASVTADGQTRPLDGNGAFQFDRPVGANSVLASAPGYASQLAIGPPFAFVLAPQLPRAAPALVIDGQLAPPLALALVSYQDATGSYGRGVSDAQGHFHLEVPLALGAPAPGVLAAIAGLAPAMGSRHVTALTPIDAGAIALAAGAGTANLVVPLAHSDASFALQPGALPPDLLPARIELGAIDAAQHRVPLAEIDGDWPASLPALALPAGFHLDVAAVARDRAGAGRSVAEHLDPQAHETWRPSFWPLPAAPADGAVWQPGPGPAAAALYALGEGRPRWEARAEAGGPAVPLPTEAGQAYTLELASWDAGPLPWPSLAAAFGPPGDRRHALRRVALAAKP